MTGYVSRCASIRSGQDGVNALFPVEKDTRTLRVGQTSEF